MNDCREPAEFESRMQTKEGSSLLVRAIRPTDKDLLREAFQQLSEDTIRRRFFHVRERLPAEEVRESLTPRGERRDTVCYAILKP